MANFHHKYGVRVKYHNQWQEQMQRLVPNFIIEKLNEGQLRGSFVGAAVFVDLSGFSKMTDSLSAHGEHGAEVLTRIMRSVFEPLVSAVYAQGGFVIGYAGDAFNAVFPESAEGDAAKRCLASLLYMQTYVHENSSIQTPFGAFSISIKSGMGYGEVRWRIFKTASAANYTYWFRGDSLTRAVDAEENARPGTIVADKTSFSMIESHVDAQPVKDLYQVTGIRSPLPMPASIFEPEPDPAKLELFFPDVISAFPASGEFRNIINLFIDIPVNITDEELIAPFMETVYKLQDKYGGFFLRPDLGDKGFNLLMFWGAPIARERDMDRALSFVLDLAAHTRLPLRVGVTYRLAYCGFIGSKWREDYTSYGWGVNLAARMMQGAKVGQIWMDVETAKRASSYFDLKYLGHFNFKGFSQQQAAYLLISKLVNTDVIYQGELLGRTTELGQMADLLMPLKQNRPAGVLIVRGDAGIGKSRLIHSFRSSAFFADFPSQWIHCPAEELLRQPFAPLKHWLKSRFSLIDGQTDEENWAAFQQVIKSIVEHTDDAELAYEIARTESILAALIGITPPDTLYQSLDARARYENTFIALGSLLKAESQQKPLIIFLEDAQWIDEDTIAFLRYFLRSLSSDPEKKYPVAIISALRPEGSLVLETDAQINEIYLSGLSAEQISVFAAQLLGAPLASELLELLHRRAEGNPFFAEQILRYLNEQSLLVFNSDGAFTSSKPLNSLLPVDINMIMVARLDRLTRSVRETVQTASVLGREFVLDVLARMFSPGFDLLQQIGRAEQANIWAPLSEIDYIFRHGLLRDAAYSMQMVSRLRELHQLAFESIEKEYLSDLSPHFAELAYHAQKAELVDKAVHYLNLAGDMALSVFQNRQAAAYFGRALDLLTANESNLRTSILLKRVEAYYNQGDFPAQLSDLQELEKMAGIAGEKPLLAKALALHARYLSSAGDYQNAIKYAFEARDLAQSVNDFPVMLDIFITLPDALTHTGKLEEAYENAQNGVKLARKISNPHRQASALNALGLVTMELKGPQSGIDSFQKALKLADPLNDHNLKAKILNNLAQAVGLLGNYEAAREYFSQALDICREQGNQAGRVLALANLGWVNALLGDYPLAQHYYEQALPVTVQLGARLEEMYTYINLSACSYGEQKPQDALRWAETALKRAVDSEDQIAQGWSYFYLGYAHILNGDNAKARDAFLSSIQIRDDLKSIALVAESRAGLVTAHVELGNQAAAKTEAEQVFRYMQENASFEGMEEPLRAYHSLYHYFEKTKDPRLSIVLQNALQLMDAQVSKLKSEDARRLFVENVAWRRELRMAG